VEGILLVDKPKGWTSFDVVAKVRSLVSKEMGLKPKNVKVGHTGTLDPIATGMVIVLVGKKYTKMAEGLTKKDKVYEVEFILGETSSSYDTETEVTKISDRVPERNELNEAIEKFKGDIMQIPPAFSAIKLNGVRSYDLARQGKEVELEPRKVKIISSELLSYEYPIVKMRLDVSSGTYVRSYVRDIGETLKVGAVMSNLRRTSIGSIKLDDKIRTADNLDIEYIKDNLNKN
jgi:tRNA pseudouridine55 synthase